MNPLNTLINNEVHSTRPPHAHEKPAILSMYRVAVSAGSDENDSVVQQLTSIVAAYNSTEAAQLLTQRHANHGFAHNPQTVSCDVVVDCKGKPVYIITYPTTTRNRRS